ncbi:MAG: hypothetical protein LBI11_05370 [Streptococcaceae bacterium]|jgi:major membrane immunogen (membrane-anchored lipoprotein)|nr:hypothetical protein [Streptococcaceae bacterium]
MKKIFITAAMALALVSLGACGKKKSTDSFMSNNASSAAASVKETTVDQLQKLISQNQVRKNEVYQLTATLTGANQWKLNADGKNYKIFLKTATANNPLSVIAPADSIDAWTDNTQVSLTIKIDVKSNAIVPTVTTSSIVSGATTLKDKQKAWTKQLLDAINKTDDTLNTKNNQQLMTGAQQSGAYNEFTVTLNDGFKQLDNDKLKTSLKNINSSLISATSSVGIAPKIHYVIAGEELAINQAPDSPASLTFEGSLK